MGGVLIVDRADRVRDVLVPVNRALDLVWDQDTAGSVAGERPGVTWDQAARSVLARFGRSYELDEGSVSRDTLALATRLEPRHLARADRS